MNNKFFNRWTLISVFLFCLAYGCGDDKEKELTKEMLTELIDRIEVGFDWSIEIKFRYRDEYEQLIEFVQRNEGILNE